MPPQTHPESGIRIETISSRSASNSASRTRPTWNRGCGLKLGMGYPASRSRSSRLTLNRGCGLKLTARRRPSRISLPDSPGIGDVD